MYFWSNISDIWHFYLHKLNFTIINLFLPYFFFFGGGLTAFCIGRQYVEFNLQNVFVYLRYYYNYFFLLYYVNVTFPVMNKCKYYSRRSIFLSLYLYKNQYK